MTFDLVFVHLLNDFSGSPRVLREAIGALTAGPGRPKLYVGHAGEGFLTRCGIPVTRFWYRRPGRRWLTPFAYGFSQLMLFCRLWLDRSIERNAVIYVNTLLPFGAAVYGLLTGRKVLYHLHEISVTPAPLKRLLVWIARASSSLNVYVSDAHRRGLPIPGSRARRLYNALDAEFLRAAAGHVYVPRREGRFRVLMIASLRDYKGVRELARLAEGLRAVEDLGWDLVVNDDEAAIARYFGPGGPPPGLIVHPRTPRAEPFYRRAGVVLNLSRVDQWVETFGMTVLEAMAFGVPVIVPPVGGPAELVVDGVQGLHVDSRDATRLGEAVLALSRDPARCLEMSKAGRARAAEFSRASFARGVAGAVDDVREARA